MAQLEHIEAIEKRLWKAADTLRGNSELASNEYFLPVMGLIFLRHAYSRYLSMQDGIIATLPSRGGVKRALTKEDFSQKSAIFLKPAAQFDELVKLTDADDRAEAIILAMESIEADYLTLKDQLPKQEYRSIPNDVLGILLRTLNPNELKQADGDIFGRIYEYFLTQFADQGAHDGGEFFTPVSLVQLIVNVLEPDHGKIFDPACGSGGMFVQSAHFMERHRQNPKQLTFYGHEKNRVTTRLAKMNLTVHGLEGNILGGEDAITYYKDEHEGLFGAVDFVMANPPFNVDEVDAEKIKNDRRLPFGLPGTNKNKKVSNANYLWIQYFYSYLNNKGRAGFVMSSQASSAGRDEAKVRESLVKTGHVDVMIDIRGNFFYTRSVPCQLWFFNKAKPAHLRDKVLMLDARHVYRKVTRKIYDFSPEQQQNLTAVVWLYRGLECRFVQLVADYLNDVLLLLHDALLPTPQRRGVCWFLVKLQRQLRTLKEAATATGTAVQTQLDELQTLCQLLHADANSLKDDVLPFASLVITSNLAAVKQRENDFSPLAERCRDGVKSVDHLAKQCDTLTRDTIDHLKHKVSLLNQEADTLAEQVKAEKDIAKQVALQLQEKQVREQIKPLNTARTLLQRGTKELDVWRKQAVEQLKQVRYFHKQAHWLLSRFPEGKYRDVEGLVKLVDVAALAAADWSLTPGRYVGVAAEEVDEDFDFEETLRDIHIELDGLNQEAVTLAAQIAQNFKGLI
ncbi:N-6 DNA methylase [Thiothrix litoralis]|uniref:site-specific DNA-methyltransferase (adenine-specific) n=1 Tax=Thiothrix litoralis TaxID=2891210 RepID=A0ABX7WR49_9GAMM|nr:N-6 DNA methylase [Thiothrix litoralis]QTR45601.1 N-6 DNA methylase [Thiothrix litoralis]